MYPGMLEGRVEAFIWEGKCTGIYLSSRNSTSGHLYLIRGGRSFGHSTTFGLVETV